MPKELFYNIPEEKRLKIVTAAFNEFSTNKFIDASINMIIKNAEISRGSFYQYFEDKEDIYFYILDSIIENHFDDFVKNHNSSVNLIEIHQTIFEFNMMLLSDSKYQGFFKNLYLSLDNHLSVGFNEISNKYRDLLLYESYIPGDWEVDKIEAVKRIFVLISRNLLVKKALGDGDSEDILAEHYYHLSLVRL